MTLRRLYIDIRIENRINNEFSKRSVEINGEIAMKTFNKKQAAKGLKCSGLRGWAPKDLVRLLGWLPRMWLVRLLGWAPELLVGSVANDWLVRSLGFPPNVEIFLPHLSIQKRTSQNSMA